MTKEESIMSALRYIAKEMGDSSLSVAQDDVRAFIMANPSKKAEEVGMLILTNPCLPEMFLIPILVAINKDKELFDLIGKMPFVNACTVLVMLAKKEKDSDAMIGNHIESIIHSMDFLKKSAGFKFGPEKDFSRLEQNEEAMKEIEEFVKHLKGKYGHK